MLKPCETVSFPSRLGIALPIGVKKLACKVVTMGKYLSFLAFMLHVCWFLTTCTSGEPLSRVSFLQESKIPICNDSQP
jgi:hypothetical protein